MKALCNKAKEILIQESNVQHVESPVTVSGAEREGGPDIFGNFLVGKSRKLIHHDVDLR